MDERKQTGQDRRTWRDSHRFALNLQMLGQLVLLLVVCTVLVQLYAGVMQTSLRSEALNKGVLLCRNAAELFSQSGDIAQTSALMGGKAGESRICFDRELKTVDREDAWLEMELSEQPGEPGVRTCRIQITRNDETVYTLDVAALVTEGGQ